MKRDYPYRRSHRLPGWDYRMPGPYAITMCTEDRIHRFGTVRDGCMVPSAAGKMVHDVWMEMRCEFPRVTLDAFVIMPNHVHAIVLLDYRDIERNPRLGAIVQRFKSITTTRYINAVREGRWAPFDGRLWQRDFYDHIVRDDRDLDRCRAYIEANPANWITDRDNVPPGSPSL